jgi:hypothetical protein
MSQRLGMADGRCFTVNNSSKLYNDYIMAKNGIKFEDNYSYRKFLQQNGPQVVKVSEKKEPCGMCDSTLNLSKIY